MMQLFKNMKFKQKLIVSYIVVTIIPITILGLFSYYKSGLYLYQQLETVMKNDIRQISSNISYKLEKQEKLMKYLVTNGVLRDILANNYADTYLLQYAINRNLDPLFTNYKIINSPELKKLCIYSNSREYGLGQYIESGWSVKDESWYKEASSSLHTKWWFDGSELFGTCGILSNYANKFIGVLYLEFDRDAVFSEINQEGAFEYGFIVLDDKNETVYEKNNFRDTACILGKQQVAGCREGKRIIGKNEYILIENTIPETGWRIFYYVLAKSTPVDTFVIIKATGTMVLVCILLLAFLIWLISNSFVKRIHELNRMMVMVEQGDMQIEVSSVYTDEIGNLTNSFGSMLKKVKSLMQEVYQSRLVEKETWLKLLQAQINPHFLYNSLSVINWKALKIDSLEISEITNLLARFYRTTLNKGRDMTSIANEIDNIKSYITLQLIMHNYSFDVIYDFQDEIFRYSTVNFILQPIIENAILHGIDKKEKGRGVLSILGHIHNEAVEFIIKDNGAGIDKATLSRLFEFKESGYGLRNVNERIQLFYGTDYGISAGTGHEGETVVKVIIPKQYLPII